MSNERRGILVSDKTKALETAGELWVEVIGDFGSDGLGTEAQELGITEISERIEATLAREHGLTSKEARDVSDFTRKFLMNQRQEHLLGANDA